MNIDEKQYVGDSMRGKRTMDYIVSMHSPEGVLIEHFPDIRYIKTIQISMVTASKAGTL